MIVVGGDVGVVVSATIVVGTAEVGALDVSSASPPHAAATMSARGDATPPSRRMWLCTVDDCMTLEATALVRWLSAPGFVGNCLVFVGRVASGLWDSKPAVGDVGAAPDRRC